jgi:hypothetical protein
VNLRLALFGVVLVSLLGPVGCGDDDSSSDSSDKPSTAQSSKERPSEEGKSNGVVAKSAEQILDESAAALEKASSFHMEGTLRLDGERTAVEADYERPSNFRLTFGQGGLKASIIGIDDAVFINANRAFWKQQAAGEAADALAGRWFRAPTSAKDFRSLTEDIDPKTLSYCLATDHGTLERGGSAQVDGRPAVVLIDKGDRPGTAPGKVYVAATDEPLPLRMLLTGSTRPGGKPDPRCSDDDKDDAGRKGDQLTFSRYDEELGIKAPPGAVDLTQGAAGRDQS